MRSNLTHKCSLVTVCKPGTGARTNGQAHSRGKQASTECCWDMTPLLPATLTAHSSAPHRAVATHHTTSSLIISHPADDVISAPQALPHVFNLIISLQPFYHSSSFIFFTMATYMPEPLASPSYAAMASPSTTGSSLHSTFPLVAQSSSSTVFRRMEPLTENDIELATQAANGRQDGIRRRSLVPSSTSVRMPTPVTDPISPRDEKKNPTRR